MELRHLEYFVAVVEEASFTRAAARLHVAQSGVSAQLRALERELGQPLLDRSGRRVQVTAVGAEVLVHARAALTAVAEVRSVVDEHSGLLSGRLAVGMVASSAVAFDLPAVLARFHREHPGVDIALTEATSDRLVEALRTAALDVAVIAPGAAAPPGIEVQVVADEPLVAAVPHEHPLAAATTIDLGSLRDEPLIAFAPSVGARAALDHACAAAGFEPRIAVEASDPDVLATLAASGLGVAIVPAPYAASHADRLHAVAITQPTLRGRIALTWRSGGATSPAAREFLRRARGGGPGPEDGAQAPIA